VRRIAAIVLPDLACTLARRKRSSRAEADPLGVIVEHDARSSDPAQALGVCVLAAVDEPAWRYGVRPGQSVAEATAFIGRLDIVKLARAEIVHALGEVVEVALGLGTTAALRLEAGSRSSSSSSSGSRSSSSSSSGSRSSSSSSSGSRSSSSAGVHLGDRALGMSYPGGAGAGPEDTVWLDTSGCARLVGGEDVLCDELRERVAELGYHARVAMADGPRIAQAVARWGRGERIVAPAQGARALGVLPLSALPLAPELRSWLGKLGILCIADLARLDRAKLASRLGEQAPDLLGLLAGQDDVPLCPHVPARIIVEQTSFEQEIDGTEPLSFVLGGLVSRAALRLGVRGEATSRVEVVLTYDRAVARLEGLGEPSARFELALPVPLSAAEELLRAVRAKIETLTLAAPVTALELRLDGLVPRTQAQLDLSRHARIDPNAMPALLAELEASLGPERVGVLCSVDSHRPEAQSMLVPVELSRPSSPSTGRTLVRVGRPELGTPPLRHGLPPSVPTRLLPEPVLVGRLERGGIVAIEHELYVIDRLRLVSRIDRVEWWTPDPVSRDYARAWVHTAGSRSGQREHGEAWVYLERATGRGYVHGWFE
jgi:protein ImuB